MSWTTTWTTPSRLAVALATVVAGLAVTQPVLAQPRSPQRFRTLARSVTQAGFHIDDREPAGGQRSTVCGPDDSGKTVCRDLVSEWRIAIVDDTPAVHPFAGQAVVQRLYVFRYSSPGVAERATTAFTTDQGLAEWPLKLGPFTKQPYTVFRCDADVFIVESRHRWRRPRGRLNAHVRRHLQKRCTNNVTALSGY